MTVTDSSGNAKEDQWSTRAYVIGEILISVVVLVGSGAILLLHPSDLAVGAAISAIPAVLVFWFQRRSNEQSNTNVKEATNGALKQLSDRVEQINSMGTVGSTQHLLDLQKQLAMIAASNQARLDTIDAEKRVANGGTT